MLTCQSVCRLPVGLPPASVVSPRACLCFYLPVGLFVYCSVGLSRLPACGLSACRFVCLSVSPPGYLSVPGYLSACLSVCYLPACLSAYLSVCSPACLFVRLPVCLPPACMSVRLPVCLSVSLPVCLSACLSVRQPVCPPDYMSVRLPVCPSSCLSLCLFVYCQSICRLPDCLPPACLSVCVPDLSAYLSDCVSINLSVCLSVFCSVCLSVCLFTYLPAIIDNCHIKTHGHLLILQ
jgi:hypothetical protein